MQESLRNLPGYLGFFILYIAGIMFSDLFLEKGEVSPVWPSAGIGLAAVLLYGPRVWPVISLAALAGPMVSNPVSYSFLPFSVIANTVAPLVATWFIHHYLAREILTIRVRHGFSLMVGGICLAVTSATIGVLGLMITGQSEWAKFAQDWIKWWLGDLFGVLVCSPAVLSLGVITKLKTQGQQGFFKAPPLEVSCWVLSLILAPILLHLVAGQSIYALGLSFVPFALLMWSALRFPPIYTHVTVPLICLGSYAYLGLGWGDLPAPISMVDMMVLLMFLCTLSVMPQLVAASTYERQYFAGKLVYRANHDRLTGMRNRNAFEEYAEKAMKDAHKNDEHMVLCYLDLDQFKVVNDNCGHLVGDNLIQQIACVLEENLTQGDIIARLGGDEFAILMRNCNPDEGLRRADLLRVQVENYRFVWQQRLFAFTVSIGAIQVDHKAGFTQLLIDADTACYQAKEAGRNRVKIMVPGDRDLKRHHHEVEWAVRLNKAVEQNLFQLYCQKISPISKPDDNYNHFEILLRLHDEQGNVLLPGVFIPAAERFHTMGKVDRWVVRHLLQWLAAHKTCMDKTTMCAINLSGPSLSDETFLEFLQSVFEETRVPPEKICFEITETAAIGDLRHASQFIKVMKRLGCRFSLDDFGSGLASFGYLKTLQVDYLKIDGAFVRDIVHAPVDHAMVKSINEVGHVMGKKTIAEYVESQEILAKLERLGVDYAQGYAIGRPVPIHTYFGVKS